MELKAHHYGILILTLLLIGILAGYSLFKNSIVPIAWVNGDLIFLQEIQGNAEISQKLYSQAPQLVEADPELVKLFEENNEEALFAKALQSSILNSIVKTSATDQMKAEARSQAEVALSQLDTELFNDLLLTQYGWTVQTFRERIIEPQILHEVLAMEHGDGYETWLDDVRSQANVKIWFVPFDWAGGELIQK